MLFNWKSIPVILALLSSFPTQIGARELELPLKLDFNLNLDNLDNKLIFENGHPSKIEEFLSQINSHLSTESTPLVIPYDLSKHQGQYLLRISNWGNFDDKFYELALLSIKQSGLDVWESSISKKFIDVQVNEEEGVELLKLFEQMFDYEEFKSEIVILDLPLTISETYPMDMPLLNETQFDSFDKFNDLFFKNYRPLNVIYSWFDLLVDTYPEILTVERIGKTFEGRDIKALRLSLHSNIKTDTQIKTVVLTGGIHAREWISVSSTCYVLFSLLQDYDNDNESIVKYLENLDFFFLPIMNPDGYEYTWTHDRLWRKNRQQTYHPKCFGIDIDHSFDYHFTSGFESPCSDDYAGEAAFEALESYNWDKYLNETKHTHPIYAYLDLHSYAEEILYPYAYTCELIPRDQENLLELAYGLGQAIRLNSGKYYDVLSACKDKGADLLPSMGAGSALDYMYHNKAFWAFVLKLRDSGTHGFLLPPKYINPVGVEIYAAVKYFCAFLLNE